MKNRNLIFHKALQKSNFKKKVAYKIQNLKVQKRKLKKKKIQN